MKRDLWMRLKRYHFDNLVPAYLWDHVVAAFGSSDASTLAFANKLARKLGWQSAFARRAIEEYRKFAYLGVVADFPVTPPKIIDQVWHEHLLFSRAYREFCRDVLQHDFDHHPELVPSAEQLEQYEAQYDATLALYRIEFNVTPPAAFWGTPKFSRDAREEPARKARVHDSGSAGGDALPLYTHFDGTGNAPSYHELPEFGGSGGFGGGGGGDEWGDGSAHSGDASGGDSSGGDSSGGDSSGGDSGGSDGGGSGCSSGCGGGGD